MIGMHRIILILQQNAISPVAREVFKISKRELKENMSR